MTAEQIDVELVPLRQTRLAVHVRAEDDAAPVWVPKSHFEDGGEALEMELERRGPGFLRTPRAVTTIMARYSAEEKGFI